MVNLHDIRYVRVGTTDLDSAIRFATDIVGLQLVAREGKAAYFRSDKIAVRGDTRDHTMVYFEGDPADQAIGFDLRDPARARNATSAASRRSSPHTTRPATASNSSPSRSTAAPDTFPAATPA